MAYYIKRPTRVHAERFISAISLPKGVYRNPTDGTFYVITTLGQVSISFGDWVVIEADGIHHFPCDNEVFLQTYQLDERQ